MDIDPLESATGAAEESVTSRDRERARLSTRVAVTVALLATFLGVCKVKDDNIVQAMQQAQADRLDHWNFYQARNIREEVATSAATQLKLAAAETATTITYVIDRKWDIKNLLYGQNGIAALTFCDVVIGP